MRTGMPLLAVLTLTVPAVAGVGPKAAGHQKTLHVNCARGRSIMRTLERLDPDQPHTVVVRGTCTESVEIRGFEQLTLLGVNGATIQAPGDLDPTGGLRPPLAVTASRGVTVEGLTLLAAESGSSGLAIHGGASDVVVRDVTVEGSLWLYERGQALIGGLHLHVEGGFGMFVGDMSDLHLEDSFLENTAPGWSVGAYVMSVLNMHHTTFRDFEQGLYAAPAGSININDYGNLNAMGGPLEVLIESPSGLSRVGCEVAGRVDLGAPLRITNAGQSNNWESAAVVIRNGGSMITTAGQLEISASRGQGILVADNGALWLGPSTISGGLHGGLVVVNQSTAAIVRSGATLDGNAVDVFCDSTSLISGGDQLVGTPTIQCPNLRPGHYDWLP